MATITIIGSGVMGTALCWPLADNGHRVHLVGTHLDEDIIEHIRSHVKHPKLERTVPANVTPYSISQINAALQNTDLVVSGVSSFGVDWFAEIVGPHLKPNIPVIAVTKGLGSAPNGDLVIFPEVIDQQLPHLA